MKFTAMTAVAVLMAAGAQAQETDVPGNRRATQGLVTSTCRTGWLSYFWASPWLPKHTAWMRQVFGGWESSGILTLKSRRSRIAIQRPLGLDPFV